MSIDFDLLDFSESDIINISKDINNNNNNNNNNIIKLYDKTTTETYRIKRLYKIDPLTDQQIPEHLIIEFKNIWNPPQNQFQGYYGEYLGGGSSLEIKSRGTNPEKYLYRLPIIDCYLPLGHNLATITMGPKLTDEQIELIDGIVSKYHKNKNNFTPLKTLKEYYDNAICSESELAINSNAKTWFKSNNYKLDKKEHLEKFNRFNVDKLVNLKY